MEYTHVKHTFLPVYNEESRILILGSFPSVKSRENQFYYGHPQNRFWKVIAGIFKEPLPQTIDEKKDLLLRHRIAVWDVIDSCDIVGSSDSSIRNVVPNDMNLILSNAKIQGIFANGGKAHQLFVKYCHKEGMPPLGKLPSTSPANAAWGFDRLSECWLAALDGVRPATDDEVDSFKCEQKSAKRAGKGEVEYAHVRIPAPDASSYAVHKSMQGNKRKDTKPELLVRQRLREAGLGGYRLQWKVPGHPDVAWPGKKVALFIHGCYWHRCPHCNLSLPKKNTEYWVAKFNRNQERDAQNEAALIADGWKVHVVWECELKKSKREEKFAKLLPVLAHELGKELR